ncbi:hypothetical protein U1Q18_020915 [Sarracenia purpurea var. burkii]
MSVSSSLAKKSDRSAKKSHGQSDTQGSRGSPENPSTNVPELAPIPLARKEAHLSLEVCGTVSSVNLGMGAKIMGSQSLSKARLFQNPDQADRESPNQDRRGESGVSVGLIFDRSLQIKEMGQEGFDQPRDIVDLMEMEIANGEESSAKHGVFQKPSNRTQPSLLISEIEGDRERQEYISEMEILPEENLAFGILQTPTPQSLALARKDEASAFSDHHLQFSATIIENPNSHCLNLDEERSEGLKKSADRKSLAHIWKVDSNSSDPPLSQSLEQKDQGPTSDFANLDDLLGETLKGNERGYLGIPIPDSGKFSSTHSYQFAGDVPIFQHVNLENTSYHPVPSGKDPYHQSTKNNIRSSQDLEIKSSNSNHQTPSLRERKK